MARKGSISRTQSRKLASLARRGRKQIAQDEVKLVKEERQEFVKKGVKDRLKYYYKNSIPTKKGRIWFWCLMPITLPLILAHTIIQTAKLDIAWKWAQQLYFVIKK